MGKLYNVKDFTGQKFGRWTVLERSARKRTGGGAYLWLCRCKCGTERVVAIHHLQSGASKSCGCYLREWASVNGKNNFKHGKRNTSTYSSYQAMLGRCLNPKDTSYKYYGALGVEVCPSWIENFANFLRDMGDRPPFTSLDRIDAHGSYNRENCRWATSLEQVHNRKDPRTRDIQDAIRLLADFSRRTSQEKGVEYGYSSC